MSPRLIWLFIVCACTGLLAYGIYTESAYGLLPCALCMTQRAFYVGMAAFSLAALLHCPGIVGSRIYSGLILLSGGLGIATAGRQVWLQHLPPDQVPACGPSLGYMLESFPLSETFKTLMMGDGNCAEVQWTLLSLSMPTWSLIAFIGLSLSALVAALLTEKHARQGTQT